VPHCGGVQGENDLYKLSARNDTTMHIAPIDNMQSHASDTKELFLSFHSFVMADALLAGTSGLSYAAGWLSKGWVWAFQYHGGHQSSRAWTQIKLDGEDQITILRINPPRWPRRLEG
jgi:hypothetical protein